MHKCEICGKEFEKGQSLGAHKNSHNPETKRKMHPITTILLEVKKICPKCGKPFTIKRRIRKDGNYSSSNEGGVYCGHICANGQLHTEEWKKHISIGISGEHNPRYIDGRSKIEKPKKVTKIKEVKKIKVERKPKVEYFCTSCGKKISGPTKTTKCIVCRYENTDKMRKYRSQCAFQINVFNYPEEFDLDLIAKHGMYSAKNKEDNPNGITRDHMISVKYGFDNHIPPEIVRHPANCRLITHMENMKKNRRCILTIEQLSERIKSWDEKYAPIAKLVR